ncbi:hypothetical protein ACFQY4_15670 [Catellatospora bangladeshensis]|uniref:hypothetical protein n=1 Tax=Catellatospora bangladeshensis TaxID=310355 RepID=UPI00360D4750
MRRQLRVLDVAGQVDGLSGQGERLGPFAGAAQRHGQVCQHVHPLGVGRCVEARHPGEDDIPPRLAEPVHGGLVLAQPAQQEPEREAGRDGVGRVPLGEAVGQVGGLGRVRQRLGETARQMQVESHVAQQHGMPDPVQVRVDAAPGQLQLAADQRDRLVVAARLVQRLRLVGDARQLPRGPPAARGGPVVPDQAEHQQEDHEQRQRQVYRHDA